MTSLYLIHGDLSTGAMKFQHLPTLHSAHIARILTTSCSYINHVMYVYNYHC